MKGFFLLTMVFNAKYDFTTDRFDLLTMVLYAKYDFTERFDFKLEAF